MSNKKHSARRVFLLTFGMGQLLRMFALVVGQLRPAVVSRTRWTSLQAHGSVVMTGDRSHPARLIDALP
ncbi:hypothetical protein N9250_03135, partial [bacterium]|nr:hypothetical protein [bacterium]